MSYYPKIRDFSANCTCSIYPLPLLRPYVIRISEFINSHRIRCLTQRPISDGFQVRKLTPPKQTLIFILHWFSLWTLESWNYTTLVRPNYKNDAMKYNLGYPNKLNEQQTAQVTRQNFLNSNCHPPYRTRYWRKWDGFLNIFFKIATYGT